MSPEVRRLVLDVYADAEKDVSAAGPVCVASGRCCRFKEWGHTLFLSNLEAQVLLESAPPYETPVSADFCPFQKDKLCTAREPRPLGCRVYFCDPHYQDRAAEITETHLRRLKHIAEQHDLPWKYAPLHVFLNEVK
jgi:Fe-S-cluster containining protein